jgi:hypothetical protein
MGRYAAVGDAEHDRHRDDDPCAAQRRNARKHHSRRRPPAAPGISGSRRQCAVVGSGTGRREGHPRAAKPRSHGPAQERPTKPRTPVVADVAVTRCAHDFTPAQRDRGGDPPVAAVVTTPGGGPPPAAVPTRPGCTLAERRPGTTPAATITRPGAMSHARSPLVARPGPGRQQPDRLVTSGQQVSWHAPATTARTPRNGPATRASAEGRATSGDGRGHGQHGNGGDHGAQGRATTGRQRNGATATTRGRARATRQRPARPRRRAWPGPRLGSPTT